MKTKTISLKKVGNASALILIFFALALPTTYIELKAVFIGIAFGASVILILKKEIQLDKTAFLAILALSLVGIFYSFWGLLGAAPGAVRVMKVYVLWPWIYLIIAALLTQSEALKILVKVFIAALLFITVYGFLYLGNSAEIVPDFLYYQLDLGQRVGLYSGYIEFNVNNISSLLFLIPFIIHYFSNLQRRKSGSNFLYYGILLLVLSSLVLAALTGRRAILLVCMASPFIIYFVNSAADRKNIQNRVSYFRKQNTYPIAFIAVVLMVATLRTMDVSYESVSSMFLDGFDFKGGSSTSERTEQFISLTRGWADGNILLGAGNGSHTSVIRDVNMVWAYELTYVYLLYSTGLLGILFYASWFFAGLIYLRQQLRKSHSDYKYVLPIVSGIIGLCTGAITNPYIGKFDYLWIIIMPYLIAGGIRHQHKGRVHD